MADYLLSQSKLKDFMKHVREGCGKTSSAPNVEKLKKFIAEDHARILTVIDRTDA